MFPPAVPLWYPWYSTEIPNKTLCNPRETFNRNPKILCDGDAPDFFHLLPNMVHWKTQSHILPSLCLHVCAIQHIVYPLRKDIYIVWFTKGRERFLLDRIHEFLRICCFPAFQDWKGFHSNWFIVDSWKHVAFKDRTIIPWKKKTTTEKGSLSNYYALCSQSVTVVALYRCKRDMTYLLHQFKYC